MSLKAFHVVFILASTLLSVGFGAWAVREFSTTREAANLVMAGGAFVAGVALIWYSRWFLRKLKHVSYL